MRSFFMGACLLFAAACSDVGSPSSGPSGPPPAPGPPGCGLATAAFCDTFDTASPGGRAGDLDDARWSAARISGANNQGQGQFNSWGATTISACGQQKSGVMPPEDMAFCAGGRIPSMHFTDSFNDAGGFTIHSYRIRQPFDFADRTGVIAFDVSAKSTMPGGHGFWFNVLLSEEPVPAPYQEGPATLLMVKGGLGVEFESTTCNKDWRPTGNTVTDIFEQEAYKMKRHHYSPSNTKCFKTDEEGLNHVEIHISQSKVDVYVADVDDPSSLRWIAGADVQLPFTRGYVNLQHTHYNAAKCTFTDPACIDCDNHACPTMPAYATYHWDNVGFDGPVLPLPRAYEAPDNNAVDNRPDTSAKFPPPFVHTGYQLGTDGWQASRRGINATGDSRVPAIPLILASVDLSNATNAALTFNAWAYCDPLKYRFNGGPWRTFEFPFPECDGSARAVMMPIALSDLQAGDNALEMWSDTGNGGVFGPQIAHVELTVNVN